MRWRILFTFLFFTGFSVYAQDNFEAGYFINNRGEKTDCFIQNNDREINPTHFLYRLTEDGDTKTGTLDSVSAFSILNTVHHFQRHRVKLERTSSDVRNLLDAKDIAFKEEVLFLRVLIEGQASLFKYTIESGTDKFFYRREGSAVNPLIYYVFKGERNTVGEITTFKQQLWNDLKCFAIQQSNLERIRYAEQQLVSLFNRYNECKNPASKKEEAKKLKAEHQWAFFAGANWAALEVKQKRVGGAPSNGGGGSGAVTKQTDQQLSPVIGLSFTHVLPNNKGAWALFFEPAFQIYKNELADVLYPSGNSTMQSINYTHVTFPAGVKRFYKLKGEKKMYLKGAVTWNLVINSSYVFGKELTLRTFKGLHHDGFYAIPNALLGAGLVMKNKYSLEAQYHINKTMLDNMHWQTRFVNSVNILLGYRLR